MNDFEQFAGTCDRHAFTGVRNGSSIDLQPFLPSDLTISEAMDVNNAGAVLVRASYNGGPGHAFVYDGVAMTELQLPSNSEGASPMALNDTGRAAGSCSWNGAGNGLAVVWDGTQPTVLPPIPGTTYASANDINNRNQVVGFSHNIPGGVRATLWDNEQPRDLGDLPGGFVRDVAYGLNDAGQVVGGAYLPSGDARAFIWENGVMRNLNDLIPAGTGWILREAYAINEQGWIVGSAREPGGGLRGFLLIPEPSAVLSALVLITAGRKWSRGK